MKKKIVEENEKNWFRRNYKVVGINEKIMKNVQYIQIQGDCDRKYKKNQMELYKKEPNRIVLNNSSIETNQETKIKT